MSAPTSDPPKNHPFGKSDGFSHGGGPFATWQPSPTGVIDVFSPLCVLKHSGKMHHAYIEI